MLFSKFRNKRFAKELIKKTAEETTTNHIYIDFEDLPRRKRLLVEENREHLIDAIYEVGEDGILEVEYSTEKEELCITLGYIIIAMYYLKGNEKHYVKEILRRAPIEGDRITTSFPTYVLDWDLMEDLTGWTEVFDVCGDETLDKYYDNEYVERLNKLMKRKARFIGYNDEGLLLRIY